MKAKPPIENLVAYFGRYLAYFEKKPPFANLAQLTTHRRTITLRRRLGSAAAALGDDRFLDSLAETLNSWDVGKHNSVLVEALEFRRQLRSRANEIIALDAISIDEADTAVGERIWRIIRSVDIVLYKPTLKPTQSKIVGGSKALHHILPDLMPPIDRVYTGFFLQRTQPYHFQSASQEAETFRLAFDSFRAIASAANPVQYVDRHEWNTSRTKVIDNGIVGFVRSILDQVRLPTKQSAIMSA